MDKCMDLLNKIKLFSKSDFEGVYSRPFAKHVIINSNNPKTKNFSVVYCDFNKLNDINQKYSEKFADMLIDNTYKTIHKYLDEYFPNCDFSISRFGGDEFLIIIDSCDKDLLQNCFENIHTLLVQEQNPPKFVDFAYGIVGSDEKNFDNIFEMINTAENIQSINKIFPDIANNNYSFDETLKIRVNRSINNFFKNFRLSNYMSFDIIDASHPNSRDIQPFIKTLLNNTINLLSDSDKISELSNKFTEITSVSNMYSSDTLFSEEQCMNLYKYVNSTSLNNENPDNISANDLESFLDLLIREPVSKFYNKSYFHNYFMDAFKNSDTTFSTAILADTTYMKDSNLKIGHDETDNKMRLISTQLKDGIESINRRPFSEDNFSINPENNYIFGLGGGNYLILSRDNISKQYVDELIDSIIPTCKPLGLTYSIENIEHRKDLKNVLNSLFAKSTEKKKADKASNLDFSEKNIIDTFNIFLSPTLKYYLENNPNDPLDITELSNFMNTLLTSVTIQVSEYVNSNLENNKCTDFQEK